MRGAKPPCEELVVALQATGYIEQQQGDFIVSLPQPTAEIV
eukprot:SAG31_NODE_8515_length_1438_cov_0.828230_2_plen_40_part_01